VAIFDQRSEAATDVCLRSRGPGDALRLLRSKVLENPWKKHDNIPL